MNNLLITKHSHRLAESIVNQMEGRTFHHHFHILYDIVTAINKDNINFFEIGSFCGASSSLVLSHQKIINAFCLDTFSEASPDLVARNLSKFKKSKDSNFTLIEGDSTDALIVSKARELVKNIDLLYIDGDHSFNGCLTDFLNYSDLVNPGGYIVFDDYNDVEYSPQVKHAVDFIVSDFILGQFEVIGCFKNLLNAHPREMIYNNQFVLKRL